MTSPPPSQRILQAIIAGVLLILAATVAPAAYAEPAGVAFHLDSNHHLNRAIRQVSRHQEASPDVPVRVILIAEGVDAAVEGATDSNGGLYSAQIEQLLANGVRVFACENTMTSFNLTEDDLTFGVETVKSGVAELGRLQVQLGFGYIKL